MRSDHQIDMGQKERFLVWSTYEDIDAIIW